MGIPWSSSLPFLLVQTATHPTIRNTITTRAITPTIPLIGPTGVAASLTAVVDGMAKFIEDVGTESVEASEREVDAAALSVMLPVQTAVLVAVAKYVMLLSIRAQ